MSYRHLDRSYCFIRGRECFSIDQYEPDLDDPKTYIRICKSELNNDTVHNHLMDTILKSTTENLSDLVLGWVSVSTSLISIAALIVTLVTYLLFNELRNIPGWNVINLTLALTIAQSAFLSGSFVSTFEEACFAISVLAHYGFMASFFWMNVIAFDFYRNFREKSSHVLLLMINVKDRLPKYLLYGWVAPLIFVGITVLFDFILGETSLYNSSFRPCYADYLDGCWLEDLADTHNNPNDICYESRTRIIYLKSCWIQNG
jgi:hypothetical protein